MFLEHFVKFYDKMVVGDLHHTGGNYIGFWRRIHIKLPHDFFIPLAFTFYLYTHIYLGC